MLKYSWDEEDADDASHCNVLANTGATSSAASPLTGAASSAAQSLTENCSATRSIHETT
eukprot:CAMPEP_0177523284 /NCGR_PEP_ID=MMETSP0369-20130122/49297_1 /TAXON_ID=447022 ORGANISM="Scrippsiella hangoei-like, Strain SHHI-4" /NCGR_SAMPLE_ID=MMETSP0369 /ASSEMBLY_ACC=CAM_ASM_000364 /LENGTH=58 /DNA_ID=CAMNT_0019003089 /DNA_START=20 /DNA_END=197 /DNA_ORIENTATION=+